MSNKEFSKVATMIRTKVAQAAPMPPMPPQGAAPMPPMPPQGASPIPPMPPQGAAPRGAAPMPPQDQMMQAPQIDPLLEQLMMVFGNTPPGVFSAMVEMPTDELVNAAKSGEVPPEIVHLVLFLRQASLSQQNDQEAPAAAMQPAPQGQPGLG